VEGLAEWLAENNGNGVMREYREAQTNDPLPPGFVRLDGDRFVRVAVGEVGKPFKIGAVRDVLEELGYDPLRSIVSTLQDTEALSAKDRVTAELALMPFVHPKLSSVEVDANVKGGPELDPIERASRVAAILAAGGADAARLAAVLGTVGAAARPADSGAAVKGGQDNLYVR
jgi:hypothetical protein